MALALTNQGNLHAMPPYVMALVNNGMLVAFVDLMAMANTVTKGYLGHLHGPTSGMTAADVSKGLLVTMAVHVVTRTPGPPLAPRIAIALDSMLLVTVLKLIKLVLIGLAVDLSFLNP